MQETRIICYRLPGAKFAHSGLLTDWELAHKQSAILRNVANSLCGQNKLANSQKICLKAHITTPYTIFVVNLTYIDKANFTHFSSVSLGRDLCSISVNKPPTKVF